MNEEQLLYTQFVMKHTKQILISQLNLHSQFPFAVNLFFKIIILKLRRRVARNPYISKYISEILALIEKLKGVKE